MTTSTKERTGMVTYQELEEAKETLKTGGLLLYPADSLWSIGCDATDPVAVERVCNLKGDRSTESFEILVDSIEMIRRYVDHLHPKIETLLAYHVRPLTVKFNRGRNLPERLLAADGSVAIRLAQDPSCRSLITHYRRPLVATTANRHDHPHPSSFGAISSAIIEGVDYVIKHRQQEKDMGDPPVMVRLSERGELEFLRE